MSDPRWLSDDQQHAWRRFMEMHRQLRTRIAKQLSRETGLSEADYEVLVCLSESSCGRLRPYELGQMTTWDTSRLSHHLRRMVVRGLVTREACPTDQRGAIIAITPAGQKAIEAAAPAHVEHVRRWFIDALTPEQLTALDEIAGAVVDKLAADPPPA